MKDKITKTSIVSTFVAVIIMAVLVGLGYVYLAQNEGEKEFVPVVINEIKTGQFDVDVAKVNELQEAVDRGHQPWRLDPLMVAKAEALKYGFVEQDNFTLKEIIEASGRARVEVIHSGISYSIILIQITPGEGKIWMLQKIEK